MICGPRFIVCDEPVSALDVSVQGQIVNLLSRIRRGRGLAGLFISHNLAVVAGLCERVMVMYLGRIVEIAPRVALLPAPLHPYTRMLLDAVPRIAPQARRRAARAATADQQRKSVPCLLQAALSPRDVPMSWRAAVRSGRHCSRCGTAGWSPVTAPQNGLPACRRPRAESVRRQARALSHALA